MRIKYTIYWFEDKNSWLREKDTIQGVLDISKYLKKYGFEINIIFFVEQSLSSTRDFMLKEFLDKYPEKYKIEKLDNYKDSNLEKIDFLNVDLVLMDYNLGAEKGNNVIEYIRNDQNDIYTDILFYSQNESERELRKKSDKDGLYCSERSELFSENKIKKVIKTTIRKTQELNNLRGLVMAETSELDEMMKEILKLVAEKDKVEDGKIVKTKKRLIEWYKKNNKELESYKLPDDFLKLIKSKHFSSFFSHSTICSFSECKKNDIEKEEVIPYGEEIIPLRNKLAHKDEVEKLGEEDFIKIRENIQKYKRIFQKIIDDLMV